MRDHEKKSGVNRQNEPDYLHLTNWLMSVQIYSSKCLPLQTASNGVGSTVVRAIVESFNRLITLIRKLSWSGVFQRKDKYI